MKAKYFKLVICGILCLFCLPILYADQEDGGQAGAFLRYGVGARALGMGRAFVASADDASGIYWNPAGILGAKRNELTSLYSNLYYDSRYAFFGFILPRPFPNIQDKIARFFIGPAASFGFGWIGLSVSGFEQRTSTGVYLGDFGISESAFLTSWAREEVGSWGIFRYGITFKFVNQNFPGVLETDAMLMNPTERDWSGGLDLGFSFQPIHAPLFRLISLKYLIPLRLGFSCQNLVQPSWRQTGNEREFFPRVYRWGLGYRWILKDWIPTSWKSLHEMVGHSHILTVLDKEYFAGLKSGTYFGMEGYFPMLRDRFTLFPRFGINSQTEGPSLGLGLSFPFSSSAVMRLDYAYGFHPYLYNDNRFSLTVQIGKEKGATYFKRFSERDNLTDKDVRNYLLRVLSEYPNEHVMESVAILVELEDSVYVRRYYSLTGGLGHASWLLRDAKELLKQGKIAQAKKKALKAANEYMPIFIQPEHSLGDQDLMDFGEALIIANQLEEAVTVLEEVEEPDLRSYFLLGTCQKYLDDLEDAIETFGKAVKRYEQEQDLNSMVTLSLLGLGETLMRKEQYQSAYTTLRTLLKHYSSELNSDYPRYPIYNDNYVIDDAQFLLGIANVMGQHYPEGITDFLVTQKFFPDLEFGRIVGEKAEGFIKAIEGNDWPAVDELTKQFSDHYLESHQLP